MRISFVRSEHREQAYGSQVTQKEVMHGHYSGKILLCAKVMIARINFSLYEIACWINGSQSKASMRKIADTGQQGFFRKEDNRLHAASEKISRLAHAQHKGMNQRT